MKPLHDFVVLEAMPVTFGDLVLAGEGLPAVTAKVKSIGRKVTGLKVGNVVLLDQYQEPVRAGDLIQLRENEIGAVLE